MGFLLALVIMAKQLEVTGCEKFGGTHSSLTNYIVNLPGGRNAKVGNELFKDPVGFFVDNLSETDIPNGMHTFTVVNGKLSYQIPEPRVENDGELQEHGENDDNLLETNTEIKSEPQEDSENDDNLLETNTEIKSEPQEDFDLNSLVDALSAKLKILNLKLLIVPVTLQVSVFIKKKFHSFGNFLQL